MDAAARNKLVIDSLEDLKAHDIKVIDVSDRSTVTDTMVIATGTSSRHAQALADNVSAKAKAAGEMPLGSEGRGNSDWVLIDLGDVIVHVMTAQTREYYDLESLWEESQKTST